MSPIVTGPAIIFWVHLIHTLYCSYVSLSRQKSDNYNWPGYKCPFWEEMGRFGTVTAKKG